MLKYLLYLYFLFPKFDLITFSFSPTGIRFHDFLTLLMFMVVSLVHKIHLIRTFSICMLLLIGGTISGIILSNSYYGLLGIIRLMEYIIVGYTILLCDRKIKIENIFLKILTFHVGVGVFQFFYLFPNIDPGRGIFFSSEFSGLFANPAELTYFLIVCLPFFSNSKQLLILRSIVVLNGVKAGILNFLVTGKKLMLLHLFLIILLIDFVYIGLLEKLVVFFAQLNTQMPSPSLNEIKLHSNSIELEGALSLQHRLGKWINVLGFLANNPSILITGVGYGRYPGALDGGLLKLLFEVGLPLTLILMITFFRAGIKVFLVFLFVNLLFDGSTSSVVAPILIFHLLKHRSERTQDLQFNRLSHG